MKDATFTLEFTQHVLGNAVTADGKDRFQRDNENRIVFQQAWFHSAFCQGIELARLRGIKASDIHMDLTFTAPTVNFNRRYGQDKHREHEAITPGTRVQFNAVVADIITEQVLRQILERVGKYVGISPYGYKLGYGKFNVVSVSVAPSDAAQDQ